ncbi:hypothetical protein COCSUDRAFT_30235 [Coccomyxa subellipsoidea C-169]|uniref:Uncharacterized protein n=1 Tax=Coccomyxa subellipsoidea (strain C-169) TaxID=574566 RepID=I0YRN7_COCSC|nr:hypothetical protein COCSUDRAFT_30235 [Coccomyxa subellipsoidea C-169]EIE21056.1 hypothetical protein COCSUDRAFT_30235 [Coccomyxa subellipsoidea C-169]|eukprot:XP_005645600.1 hypothetical protein COCSUDRAFT_30235 [Coccomyxa subellipsoidea C-169]
MGSAVICKCTLPSFVGFQSTSRPLRKQIKLSSTRKDGGRASRVAPRAGLEIDWSDPDTLIGVAGGVLGLLVGIGAPLFYISRDEKDEQKLEELRELNRQTFKETGEYLTEEEIKAFRQPRWTDRREFQDDD